MKLCEGNALYSVINPAVSVNECANSFQVIFLVIFADEHKGLVIVFLGKIASHRVYLDMK